MSRKGSSRVRASSGSPKRPFSRPSKKEALRPTAGSGPGEPPAASARGESSRLEASRPSYLDLYENAPVGYLTFDKRGRVLNMNLTAARLLGVERDLFLGKRFSLLVAPGFLDAFADHGRRALCSTGTERCELMLKTGGSEKRLFHAQLESVASAAPGMGTVRTVLTDITERKRAEEALDKSRLHLSQAMEIARIVCWERDPETSDFIFNAPFYAFYGTTAEREGGYIMTGEEYVRRFVHPDDVGLVLEVMKECESRGPGEYVADVEHRIVRRDGEVRWILARIRSLKDGAERTVRCYGANQDITKRKRYEDILKQSERQYRELAELLPQPVFEADADCVITFANNRAYEATGYGPEDVAQGLSLYDLVIPEQRGVAAGRIKRIFAGKHLGGLEYAVRRKDGGSFPALAYVSAVEKDSAVVGLRGVVADISERTAHAEALHASRLQLEEAANLARIAYWEFDPATDEFVFNDRFYELYGTTAEREGGYRISREEYGRRFVNAEDLQAVRRKIDENRGGPCAPDREQYEHRGIRADGGTMHILNRNRTIMDREGRIVKIVGVNQDITARKKMEQALRESETKLRAILDNSRDAIWVSQKGTYTFANPAFLSLFGYESQDELKGRTTVDFIAPESRGIVEANRRKHTEDGGPSLYELTGVRKDGTTFMMETTVSRYSIKGEEFVLSIFRDITTRKRHEEEIELLKRSIDVHYDGAYWMDEEGRFVYVNDAACRTLGYGREELIGKTLADINPTATRERIKAAWEKVRKGGFFLGETVHRRKNGEEFPVEIMSSYVRFGGREFSCAFARDITEKKKLEEQLRQAHKMEAVGTLAGGIAHDFNNVLAIVLGNAELALDEIDKEGPRQNINQIVKASKRARDLTRQILTFSRRTERARNPVGLEPLLKETNEMLRGTLPTTIRMKLDLRAESDIVLADPSQIQQVLVNLATNAAHAMRDSGGILTVSLENITLRESQLPGLSPGEYVKLSVQDTGAGMSEEVRRRAFEPFFTTKGPDEGTGMGLAVVYGIVKGHEGEITVESVPDKGTVFNVFLPLASSGVRREREETGSGRGGHERVLLVDDEPDVLQMTARTLESLRYRVTTAPGGEDGWRIFSECPGSFDLVITDQVMPGLTGLGLARRISEVSAGTPVILFTGYSETVSPGQARESGIRGFIMKPITKKEMAETVRRVLDGNGAEG